MLIIVRLVLSFRFVTMRILLFVLAAMAVAPKSDQIKVLKVPRTATLAARGIKKDYRDKERSDIQKDMKSQLKEFKADRN